MTPAMTTLPTIQGMIPVTTPAMTTLPTIQGMIPATTPAMTTLPTIPATTPATTPAMTRMMTAGMTRTTSSQMLMTPRRKAKHTAIGLVETLTAAAAGADRTVANPMYRPAVDLRCPPISAPFRRRET